MAITTDELDKTIREASAVLQQQSDELHGLRAAIMEILNLYSRDGQMTEFQRDVFKIIARAVHAGADRRYPKVPT